MADSRSSSTPAGIRAPAWPGMRSMPPTLGREAPLDLIEEHLTDTSPTSAYRQGLQGGRLLNNWFVPEEWNGVAPVMDGQNYVLKVQSFDNGGYEATVRAVDLEKIGRAMEPERLFGKREKPEEVSQDNLISAAKRAKRRVRHLVRNMMATNLVTFTKRELKGAVYWTEEQWQAAWDKVRRMLERVIGKFPYVAILEEHEKGNFHLHVAWVGKANVNLLRRVWLSVLGGKGKGNIDAQWIKVPHGHDRSSRVAGYMTKYITKSFLDSPRFNKKRYWASKQTLSEARRYVLRAMALDGAMDEVKRMLGLDISKFMVLERGEIRLRNWFPFPGGEGVWINYLPDIHGEGELIPF